MVNTESRQKKIGLYIGDFIAVAVVLLLSFLVWLSFFLSGRSDGRYVYVIEGSDTVILKCDMANDKEYVITSENGITINVKTENGFVAVTQSNCPNGYCRGSAPISKDGDVIVCAPAHLKIKIVSGGENGENSFIVG